MQLSELQLTGREDSHLGEAIDNCCLQSIVADAFHKLQEDARRAGFDLRVASGFRSFQRQLEIWNGKLGGSRPVHDDNGNPVQLEHLSVEAQLHAVLRFSALPGASRHHWGTDLDVFDANALKDGEVVRLEPAEVSPGGVFDPMHTWLDQQIEADEARGFYRPYQRDRGGVAPERWHLSFRPLAQHYATRLTPELLCRCWHQLETSQYMALRDQVESLLPTLFPRYIGA